MNRWSFNLQIYFLNNRYRQIVEIQKGDKTVIQDRSIYEDAHIFAPNLHQMGLMPARDFQNYFDLFELMSSQVNPPDLLIYLKASVPTLVNHIQTRGREYESTMSLHYLQSLNDKYDEWIESYTIGKLLVLDVNELDYKNNTDHRQFVIDEVSKKLKLPV